MKSGTVCFVKKTMQYVFVQRDRDKDAWSETGGRRKRECGFPFRKLRTGRFTDLRIHRKRHLERALFRCRRTVSSHDAGLEKKVNSLLTGGKCDDIIIKQFDGHGPVAQVVRAHP